jgi:hypothetical protein
MITITSLLHQCSQQQQQQQQKQQQQQRQQQQQSTVNLGFVSPCIIVYSNK